MNILCIFTDQQQRGALGCMGNPNVDTPNLDRLAGGGVLFRRAYSSNPVCTPFRIGLFTGLFNSATGTHRICDPIPPNVRTLARSLAEGGYHTSYVGKWHIGGNGNGPVAPEMRGDFRDFIGYQCYNGFYDNVCFYDEQCVEHRFDKHRTDATTDIAIERMRGCADKPFAMFVSYQAPHYPVQPAPKYAEMYTGRKIQRRENARDADIDPHTPTFSPRSPRPVDRDPDFQHYGNDLDEYIRLYNAMVTQIDDNVQRLLAEIERLNLADDTAVFFTSDHGDMQGSHAMKNKELPYEESAGIPLIARVPGGASGKVVDMPVSSLDLYPTFLDLAHLPSEAGLHGRDIADLLRGDADLSVEPVFSERPKWCMVCVGDWKFVADRTEDGLSPTMLFNLADDPQEMHNMLEDASHARLRDKLSDMLRRWDEDVRTLPPQRTIGT